MISVIPLYSASANYQEWDQTLGNETYTIVFDNGEWSLLRRHEAGCWQEIGTAQAVETFLTQCSMILEPV